MLFITCDNCTTLLFTSLSLLQDFLIASHVIAFFASVLKEVRNYVLPPQ